MSRTHGGRAAAAVMVALTLLGACSTSEPGAPASASASASGGGSAGGGGSASAGPSSTLSPAEQQAFDEATATVVAYRQTVIDLLSGARTNLNDLNDVVMGDLLDDDLRNMQKSLSEGRTAQAGAQVELVSAEPVEIDLAADPETVRIRACFDLTGVTVTDAKGKETVGTRGQADYVLVRTTYLPDPGWAVGGQGTHHRPRVVMLSTVAIVRGCVMLTLSPVRRVAADACQHGSVTWAATPPGGGATVSIGVGNSTSTSGRGSAGAASGRGTSAGTRTCTHNGHTIACTGSSGVWSQERQCWVQRVSPQPDLTGTQWADLTDGAIYQCTVPGAGFSAGTGTGYWFWAPAAGQAGAPVLIDPVVLAERAVEQMGLRAPALTMTPRDPDAPLLVGVDAWLWLDDADRTMVGPVTRTASAGPVSVTATAAVTSVEWDLGDGTRLTCDGPGTPWSPDQGTGPSPTCGHRYLTPSSTQSDGTFTVRATTHWQVDWSGAGQSGQITFSLDDTRELRVDEVQVLVTR